MSRSLRLRPPTHVSFGRVRTVAISAKKNNVLFQTAATSSSKEGKSKKSSKSSTRQRYVEEEPGATGTKGTIVPKYEAAAPPPSVEVEHMSVVASEPSFTNLQDPIRIISIGSAAVLGLWFVAMVFKRVMRPKKPREPTITVSKMEDLMQERKLKMEEEFANVLAEQLEKKEAEHKEQLLDERSKREVEFNTQLATREREVRKALDKEFKSQHERESGNLKEQLNKEKHQLEEELSEKFKEQKAEIEMEWMKKLEEKEQEEAKNSTAAREAEELVKELKTSQERLKAHEATLESQLTEYDTMLRTLKENHKIELEGTVNGYQSEIKGLKEQIRIQEEAIARRKREKEEEAERLRAAAVIQETVQDNGILREHEQHTVAVQTKPIPETMPTQDESLADTIPVHKNGQIPTELPQAEIRMVAGGTIVPHSDKVLTGGEDAFMISTVRYGGLCVADGVGSWGSDGVNPAIYPKELVASVSEYLDSVTTDQPNSVVRLVEHAHESARSPGSSTLCIGIVQPDGVLEVANVGDCGVRVIRGSNCIFATKPMAHEFNMPYQLANPQILPDTDWPSDAEIYSFELQEGDVVVMGSDGLFDNMWDVDLVRIINTVVAEHPLNENTAQLVSKRIADVAHYNAKQQTVRSPWSVHAAEAGAVPIMKRFFPQGGKMDDCTVVIGFAQRCY